MFYVISVFGVASVVIYYFVTMKRNYDLWPSDLLTHTQEEEDAVYPPEVKKEDALHVDNDIASTEPSDVVYPVSEEENIWDSVQEGETVSDTIPVNESTIEEARPNVGLDAVQQLALKGWMKEHLIQTNKPEMTKFDIDELPESQTEDFKADPKPNIIPVDESVVEEVKPDIVPIDETSVKELIPGIKLNAAQQLALSEWMEQQTLRIDRLIEDKAKVLKEAATRPVYTPNKPKVTKRAMEVKEITRANKPKPVVEEEPVKKPKIKKTIKKAMTVKEPPEPKPWLDAIIAREEKAKTKKKRVRRYRTCANCANWKPIEPVEPKK